MSFPPNWYDDPHNPTYYRYWDGTSWTAHVSPKQSGPMTPDGVPLASWGARLGARLLDNIFVTIIALPLTGYFYYRYFVAYQDLMSEMFEGSSPSPNPFFLSWELFKWLLAAGALGMLVAVVYEALFLRRGGATPGKRIVGLRVRQRNREGQLPTSVVGRRVAVMFGLGLPAVIPVFGFLFALIALLNYLWPLWDATSRRRGTTRRRAPTSSPPRRDSGFLTRGEGRRARRRGRAGPGRRSTSGTGAWLVQ